MSPDRKHVITGTEQTDSKNTLTTNIEATRQLSADVCWSVSHGQTPGVMTIRD